MCLYLFETEHGSLVCRLTILYVFTELIDDKTGRRERSVEYSAAFSSPFMIIVAHSSVTQDYILAESHVENIRRL